ADITVSAYGNLDAGDFHADQDITRVWVRGDLSGNLSTGGNIALVECYGSIDATLTAVTIGTVDAHGPIAGTFNASSSIGAVASGGAITAALDAPSIGSVSPVGSKNSAAALSREKLGREGRRRANELSV
ncbi:MAG TPA: hypothetical protein VFI31_11950, partial [Pirellulales bacterium]|nr:hypothetical protein [Pirellulales bacterium]